MDSINCMIQLFEYEELPTLGAIHKGCPHIRGGRGVRQKWTNADRGRGEWLAKCGRPLGKKIIATIFVKFTQIIWQHVCI